MHALYEVAAHPETQGEIRDEVEQVLQEQGGWTRQSLGKMRKLDSILRESQRLHPVTTGKQQHRRL